MKLFAKYSKNAYNIKFCVYFEFIVIKNFKAIGDVQVGQLLHDELVY